MQMTEGMCFGEWAIIYNIERSASAYVMEESHLFSIDKEKFKMIFAKWLFKAENDRRDFIKKTIPFLSTIPEIRFEEYYKRSVFATFYRRNEIIYDDNTLTGSLYCIYQGECSLQNKAGSYYKTLLSEHINKKHINYTTLFDIITELKKKKEKKEIKTNQVNETLMRLGVGGIGGLEICCGVTKMRHICISSSQITTILRVDIMNIPEAREKIIKSLLDIYLNVEKFIHTQYIEKKKQTKLINYRNPLRKQKEQSLIGYLTYAGTVEYNDKFFDIDSAGMIKDTEKNEMVLCDVNKYYEIEGRVDTKNIPLDKEMEFKKKIDIIKVRTVNDKLTKETLNKVDNLTDRNNVEYVNNFFTNNKERKRRKGKLMISSMKNIFNNKMLLTLSSLTTKFNTERYNNFLKSTRQDTGSKETKRAFSNETHNSYNFDSGMFKLPFITLSNKL